VLEAHRAGETISAWAWHAGVLRELTIELEEDVTVFQRACERGDPEGCFETAMRLAERDRTPEGESKAVSLLEKSCDAGSPSACIKLGIAYSNGQLGLAKDARKA
jgi:TPR repeat protein